jgi:hypothetical protein
MTDRFPFTTVATAAQQGMVRIHRGAKVRYVWPVHLAGWLSSGWRTGEEQRPPHGAAGPAIPQRPAAEVPLAVLMGAPPAAPEPQTAVLAGPEREPHDAHLPTNLLDLDLEPEVQPAASIIATTTAAAPAEVSSQNDSERNDAGSALFAGSDLSGAGGPAAEPVPLEPGAAAAKPTAVATDPSPEAPQAPDPLQAPARRGRPRKARPEAQPEAHPEPGKEPEADAPEQEQPSATENSGKQQTPASLLFSAGDDPFGIDPLL